MDFQVADIFESIVPLIVDRRAVVHGSETLSYGQLDTQANAFAQYLLSNGIAPGDSVALLMGNEPHYVVMLMGCFKARATPINLDGASHIDELSHVLTVTRTSRLFYSHRYCDLAENLASESLNLVATPSDEAVETATASGQQSYSFGPRSGDDRYVLFTGGSTGKPSGVVWRQEDAFFAALGGGNWSGPPVKKPQEVADNILRSSTHVFICSPLRHGSAQWVALSALLSGATLILSRVDGFDPESVLNEIDEHHVTLLSIVGDAFARPLLELLRSKPERWDLSTVNGVFSGGAILSKVVGAELLTYMPTAVIVDSYGSTETGGQGRWVTAAGTPVSQGPPTPPRFIMDKSTAVLDDQLRQLPVGSDQVGRIARSGHVPIEFLTQESEPPADLVEIDGVRWVVSHDLGRVSASGAIELLGRQNATLKTGGKLVHIEEIEAAIISHDAVADVMVAGTPDDTLGQRITAIIERRHDRDLTDADIDAHCRERLSSFKVPRTILWVDKVQRNHLGKLDRGWGKDLVGAPEHLQN